MIKNYLKIALRNFRKYKLFTFVNVFGLAMGVAVSMLIVLYVSHEYSYDLFHKQHERVFKLITKDPSNGARSEHYSYYLGEQIKEVSNEVKEVARINTWRQEGSVAIETTPQKRFYEPKFIFADEGFNKVFSFNILVGKPEIDLKRPFTVFLTEKTAKKYFGDANPIGKTLKYDKKYDFEIVGILSNPPSNSSILFDFVASLSSWEKIWQDQRANYGWESPANPNEYVGAYSTFLLLDKSLTASKVERLLPTTELLKKQKQDKYIYHLEPLKELHFAENPLLARYIYLFLGIALLILLLALVNYMNLTTARATLRAKEVGVRKVIGAVREMIVMQFYIESTLLSLIAFIFGLLCFEVLKPILELFLGTSIDNAFLTDKYFIIPITIIFLISILLAGSYPALLLSKFMPIQVLKGKFDQSQGGAKVRKILTTFQFATSLAITICFFLTYQQLNFMRTKDVGMKRENVMVIKMEEEVIQHSSFIRNKIQEINGVEQVAGAYSPLFKMLSGFALKIPHTDSIIFSGYISVDEKLPDVLSFKWIAKPQDSLSSGLIVNELAAKNLGINNKNVGLEIQVEMMQNRKEKVIGIFKDFPYSSLRYQMQPLIIHWSRQQYDNSSFLYVKFSPQTDLKATVAQIEQIYQSHKRDKYFEYYFLDDAFDNFYKAEDSLSKLFGAFSALSIFIACLGLLGLAAFSAETRTKEIGIRKILGASILQITTLLSKDFLKLVMIAFVIASPIAYYFMDKWLADFAYRITISWWIFALAGVSAIAIALLTVSWQSIKAAMMNPVKSLRSE